MLSSIEAFLGDYESALGRLVSARDLVADGSSAMSFIDDILTSQPVVRGIAEPQTAWDLMRASRAAHHRWEVERCADLFDEAYKRAKADASAKDEALELAEGALDAALAAESAKFSMAYTQVGLTPDGSSTYFMPRLIGTRRSLELMLTNRRLSAAEALDWGLVNRVVPDEELAKATDEWAAALASGATSAFGNTKKLVLGSLDQSFEAQMELESRAIADASRSDDAAEGISAFLNKRKADFPGR